MLFKFSVFIISFVTSILTSEAMTAIKHHGNTNRGGKVMRSDVVRKTYFDPAPPVDARRKRRGGQTQDVKVPISNAATATNNQAQVNKAEEDLANFLKKSGLTLTADAPAHPIERLEVTMKPLDLPKDTNPPPSPVGKKQSAEHHELQPRSSNSPKDALPYEVVEKLVMSIKNNNGLNVDYIVKDLKDKLDMVLKNDPEWKENDAPSKPKKTKNQNVIKEMDKIMDNFLRKPPQSSSSSSSEEAELPPAPGPVMRSKTHGAARLQAEQEEDLQFDLERDDAHDGGVELRFNLKEK